MDIATNLVLPLGVNIASGRSFYSFTGYLERQEAKSTATTFSFFAARNSPARSIWIFPLAFCSLAFH
jgi:hypothetical protein